MSFGWAGQILRLDLSNRTASTMPTEPYTQLFIGGRGISAKILYDEVDLEISPFDPENKIFFAPGVLTGTAAPSTSRLKVYGLSTNGFLGATGLGAYIPNEIKWAGYDNIIVEGKSDKPAYVYINNDSIEFKDASHLWGKDVYETQQIIKEELGDQTQIMCIGPGGEKAIAFGSIHTGWGSAAGRCGFGGIMGSKNLKAIAVRGTRGVGIAKMEEFLKSAEERRNWLKDHPEYPYMITSGDKHLPSDWFTYGICAAGNFEPIDWTKESLPNPAKEDEFYAKYALSQHGCAGCPIFHYSRFEIPDIGIGGAKCTGRASTTGVIGVDDFKVGFRIYNLINRYGLDVVSTTNIISFLMELYQRGIITEKDTDGIPIIRGDEKAIISTIHKIGKQEGFGQLFKEGLVKGARAIGRGAEDYTMEVKGLELEPYEYRTIKQWALAQATNTREIIDSISITAYSWLESTTQEDKDYYEQEALERYGVKEAAFNTSYEHAPMVTIDQENVVMAADMTGLCKWVNWYMGSSHEATAKLFSLVTGVEMSEDDLLFAAQRITTLDRAFNVMKGMRRKDDTLPKRFFAEPVPGGPFKGERLDKAKFNKMLEGYYKLHGYDKDGIPVKETFDKFGLSSEWKAFKKKVPVEEKMPPKKA